MFNLLLVILAVSTRTPNPLQAITALHSRVLQFPSWVDTNFLRYTLIIHPQDSVLSDEEYVHALPPLFNSLVFTMFLEQVLSLMPSRSSSVYTVISSL